MKLGEEAPFEEGVSSPGPLPFLRLSTGGEAARQEFLRLLSLPEG